MGLDVLLEYSEDFIKSDINQTINSMIDNEVFSYYPIGSDNFLENKRRLYEYYAKQYNISILNEDDTMMMSFDCGITNIEIPSKKFPNHLFKIGYWRSSYNANGFNRIMTKLGLFDLYEIAENKRNYIHQFPDWNIVRSNAEHNIMFIRDRNPSPSFIDFYHEACEIIIETADYVLKQDNPKKYRLRWAA